MRLINGQLIFLIGIKKNNTVYNFIITRNHGKYFMYLVLLRNQKKRYHDFHFFQRKTSDSHKQYRKYISCFQFVTTCFCTMMWTKSLSLVLILLIPSPCDHTPFSSLVFLLTPTSPRCISSCPREHMLFSEFWLLHSGSSLLLAHARRWQWTAESIGPLQPTWEIQTEFWDPVLGLIQPWTLQAFEEKLSLSLCVILPFKK